MKKILAPRLVAPTLIFLGLFAASACGDDPDSSGPPVLIVSGSDDASRNASPAASETAGGMASDSKMMWMQMHLVATVDLPALDSDAPAYEIRNGESSLSSLKDAFGMSGDFVPVDADSSGFVLGPTDGTEPTLSVYTWNGMTTWNYSSAWSAGISSVAVDCGVSSSTNGDTVPVPECATPEPPANVPTKSEAEAKFSDLLVSLGVHSEDLVLETYADDWSASVTGYLKVNGVRSNVSYYAGYGENGTLQWAGGFVGDIVKIDDYPRIGTAAAIERLNSQWSAVTPRAMDDVVIPAVSGIAEPAIAVGEAPTDSAIATAPEVATTEPEITEPATSEPELAAPEVQDVSIVGVEEELQLLYGDGVTYLVPGYAFIGETADSYTPRYSVVAIPDEFIQQAVPEMSSVDTAVIPVPETAPAVDAAVAAAEEVGKSLVGMTEAEAADTATAAGMTTRVVERDGEQFAGTMDYRTDRINVVVKDGKVVSSYVG